MSAKKSNNLELFRLAKKVPGLARAEKQALVVIADAASMRDAECRKSKHTISEEHGVAPRSFHNGLKGRKRKGGSEYFPGLLKRGIVFIKSGGYVKAGVPTVYGIDISKLRALVDGDSDTLAQTSAQALAQSEGNLGTNKGEPWHRCLTTSAQDGSDLGTGANKVPDEVPEGAPRKGTRENEEREVPQINEPSLPQSPCVAPESARLGSEKSNPGGQEKTDDVEAIQALSHKLTNQTPDSKHVRALLQRFPLSDIQEAFRDYVDGLGKDPKRIRWAEKQFFSSGNGSAMIVGYQHKAWESRVSDQADFGDVTGRDLDQFLVDDPPPSGLADADEIICRARTTLQTRAERKRSR